MRAHAFLLGLVLLLCGTAPASAGSIAVTFAGSPTVVASPGALIIADVVVTFGPTTVGGFGSGIELSFDFNGGASSGGATVVPAGWIDLTGGAFSCFAGHCENVIAAFGLTGPGATFSSGATFLAASILIDTSGLAPGVYTLSAGFSGPGDAIQISGQDLSGEYVSIPGFYATDPVPEPGTAGMLALGLVLLASTRRR